MPTLDSPDLCLCEPAIGDVIRSASGRGIGRIEKVWSRIRDERFVVSGPAERVYRVEPSDTPGAWEVIPERRFL